MYPVYFFSPSPSVFWLFSLLFDLCIGVELIPNPIFDLLISFFVFSVRPFSFDVPILLVVASLTLCELLVVVILWVLGTFLSKCLRLDYFLRPWWTFYLGSVFLCDLCSLPETLELVVVAVSSLDYRWWCFSFSYKEIEMLPLVWLLLVLSLALDLSLRKPVFFFFIIPCVYLLLEGLDFPKSSL